MRVLIFILFICQSLTVFSQSKPISQLIKEKSIELMNPRDIVFIGKTMIVREDIPEISLDWYETDKLEKLGNLASHGKGPDEIQDASGSDISAPNSFAVGQHSLTYMGSDLRLSKFTNFNSSNPVKKQDYLGIPYYNTVAGNDSLLFFRGSYSQTHLLDIYKIVNKRPTLIKEAMKIKDIPEISICAQNYLLNRGQLYLDHQNHTIYVTFICSSLIIAYDFVNDTFKLTEGKEKLPIPEVIDKTGKRISSPDLGVYAQTYRSMTSDDNYLYLLYSGYKPSWLEFMKKDERTTNSKTIKIYSKNDLKYVGEFELKEFSKLICFHNGKMYSLSDYPEPQLIVYKSIR